MIKKRDLFLTVSTVLEFQDMVFTESSTAKDYSKQAVGEGPGSSLAGTGEPRRGSLAEDSVSFGLDLRIVLEVWYGVLGAGASNLCLLGAQACSALPAEPSRLALSSSLFRCGFFPHHSGETAAPCLQAPPYWEPKAAARLGKVCLWWAPPAPPPPLLWEQPERRRSRCSAGM